MSWIAVGTAAVTTAAGVGTKAILGGDSGSSAGQVAQGAGNIVGGALSAQQAQQFGNQLAQTANPFGQYNQGFSNTLAQASAAGNFGNTGASTAGLNQGVANGVFGNANYGGASNLSGFAQGSQGLTQALNGTQIGNQLTDLINNPSSIFSTPQYQAAFGQGQNAVNATLAAQGLNASGNQLAALQNYGQSFGQQAYGTQLSQLSGLYGQALGANQQSYGQMQGAVQAGLASNNQAFNQQAALAGLNQSGNNQAFNQLSLLSGLSSGSPAAAAAAQSNVFGQVNSAGQAAGQGIGQVASGVGNLLNGLGGSIGSLAGQFGGSTNVGGLGDAGSISGSGSLFGTSAGLGDLATSYSGSNSWGF